MRHQPRHVRPAHDYMIALLCAVSVLFALPACGQGDLSDFATRYRVPTFADLDVTTGVAYTQNLLLDVYQPAGDTTHRRPALVWVHGGGFVGGERISGPLIAFPAFFAKLGYVAVSIDYRLLAKEACIAGAASSQECIDAADAATHDAQAAVRWLRANAPTYRIDPDRIAIAGESAGGITATGVGTRADGRNSSVRAWVSISGGVERGTFVDANDAPGLLFSGTDDPWIPYQWSADTAAAMRAVGVPVVLETLEGAGHVPAERLTFFESRSKDFLFDHLDLAALG